MVVLTEQQSNRTAFDEFARVLRADAELFRRTVGYRGGRGEFDVYWRENDTEVC